MTVVTAPPGWDKTTLLAAGRLVEGGRSPFAWLSLDAGDSDPSRFWSYVVEALRAADPELALRLGPVRAVGSAAVADAVVPRLVMRWASTATESSSRSTTTTSSPRRRSTPV